MYNTIDKFEGQYEFLSNFYMHPFQFKNITVRSSEHIYQAYKYLVGSTSHMVSDIDNFWNILNSSTPGIAKRKGGRIILGNKEEWDKKKCEIMHEILLAKFNVPELQKMLIDTEEMELIEGNTWEDTYWGVCDGKGLNKLGQTLMKVRDFYKNQANGSN